MKKGILIISLVTFMVVSLGAVDNTGGPLTNNDGTDSYGVVAVGQVVTAAWSNMTTWFFVWAPTSDALVLVMHFGAPDVEDLVTLDRHLVDSYIALINAMYAEQVPLECYIHDGNTVVFEYQNGVRLVWEYRARQQPYKTMPGRGRAS